MLEMTHCQVNMGDLVSVATGQILKQLIIINLEGIGLLVQHELCIICIFVCCTSAINFRIIDTAANLPLVMSVYPFNNIIDNFRLGYDMAHAKINKP